MAEDLERKVGLVQVNTGKISRKRYSPQTPVRLAVYDLLNGELVGYKTDTFWHLDKESFKVHSLEGAGLKGNLIPNLLFYLNKTPGPECCLRVDVEPLDVEERGVVPCVPLYQYVVRKDATGKYAAEKYNPRMNYQTIEASLELNLK